MDVGDDWFQSQTLDSFQFCYPKYLQAKVAIDKEAFHKDTWEYFSNLVSSLSSDTIRLLDVGAGIGAMFLHLIEGKVLDKFPSVEFILVDSNAENVLFGVRWLVNQVKQMFPNYRLLQDPKMEEFTSTETLHNMQAPEQLSVDSRNSVHAVRGGNFEVFSERNWLELQLCCETQHISLKFFWIDFISFSHAAHFRGYFDIVLAAAFLDLYDCSMVIETLFNLLRNPGIFYFPINYDGEMYFLPKYSDHSTETRIIESYHAAMDGLESDEQNQHSKSGQRVIRICKDRAVDIKYGDAWWNVCCEDPESKYFLMCILQFVQQSTKNLLKGPVYDSYFIHRKQQWNQNTFKYSARNIDCCGKVHFNCD